MKQCRAIAVASAWFLAVVGSAEAADAYDPQGAPADPYVHSGLYFRGDIGKSWFEADGDDADLLTFGAGVGFQWSPMFRTDLRVDYGIETDRDVEFSDKFGTVTANGYVDVPLDFAITPYIGAGIGYGFVSTDLADDNGLAAALMGGLTFDVSKFVAIDVGYRFRTLVTEGGLFVDDNPRDHAATIGLRFNF